ncbi:MAG: T9SS type A sorting domain-containing protein [Prevotella sp.]|nr:T9SS type A sorting domain-containing protein [Prevotella sp.]
MKKLFILAVLAGLLMPAAKVLAQGQTLVLHHADGKTSEVELFTMPRIQLTADKMIITAQGTSLEYAKTDVVRFTYKGVGTGISNVGPETRYRIDQDRVTFFGISSTDRVSVYNAGGVQIPVRLSSDGHDAVLSLADLPQGVYLVTINGKTLKFIRP